MQPSVYCGGMRPFERETAVAVAFTFGWMAASPQGTQPPGSLAALCDELAARGVLSDLLSRFDPEMTLRLMQAVTLDRMAGQKTARR